MLGLPKLQRLINIIEVCWFIAAKDLAKISTACSTIVMYFN